YFIVMRVLLMSDVHANWPALQALEADAGYADVVIHAGDSVGYYPFPNECVSWLKEHADVNVMGNHDFALVNQSFRGFSREALQVFSWTDQNITALNMRYLSNLPDTFVGEFGGVKFGVVHGGLSDPRNEFIHPYTDESLISGYLSKLGVKVLVTGHVHQMFVRQLKDGLLINPGSVGQPRDNNPSPSYVLLDVNNGKVETIMPKRFRYDPSQVEAKTISEMLPRNFLDILKRGN
ncbi:MAG TPA: metallophosphoesterase family protein, partial [Candidatus Nanoarchaeia archaeon]|nr:metallophosphoesterase family protein [Candidatus Nanoarchaeia archaeon]